MKRWFRVGPWRGLTALSVLMMLCFSTSASAQMDAQMQDAVDKFSVVSEQKLLLKGKVRTKLPRGIQQLPPGLLSQLITELGFGRFDQSVAGQIPQEDNVGAWCREKVNDMNIRRDKVDLSANQVVDGVEVSLADVELRDLIERCSDVYGYDLDIGATCKEVTRKIKVKKKTKIIKLMECKSSVGLQITKWTARQDASERLNWSVDTSWQKKGTFTLKRLGESSSEITKKNPRHQAKLSAFEGAVLAPAMMMKRLMLEVPEFQTYAPIVAVSNGTAFNCLNSMVTELDRPYFIVYNTSEGPKKVGFAKTRKFFDGCTDTPTLVKKRNKGEEVVQRPAEAQVILGDPQPGYSLSEMPSMGINFGLGGGLIGGLNFTHAPAVTLLTEFSIAESTGISELHTFTRLNLGFGLDDPKFLGVTNQINSLFKKEKLDDVIDTDATHTLMIGMDLGILKRWYLHALFFELGIAGSFTGYILKTEATFDDTAMLIGISGIPHAGIGFQLSPRFMVRLLAGFKAGVTFWYVEQADGETIEGFNTQPEGMEFGLHTGLHILYNL